MEPPMLLQEYGKYLLYPFKWIWLLVLLIGSGITWIWDSVFSPSASLWPLGWILFLAMVITSMFGTGVITLQVGATEDQVKSAYQEILHREADTEGLRHYVNNVSMDAEDVKADLRASEEKKKLDSLPR